MIRGRIPDPILFCLMPVALIAAISLPALARAGIPGATVEPMTKFSQRVVVSRVPLPADQPPTPATPATDIPTPTEEAAATPTPPPTPPPPTPPRAAIVLYDGALGTGLPATQGLLYLTQAVPGTDLAATQVFADGVTTLTTSTQTGDKAGYFANPGLVPPLDRAAGFTVHFTVRVVEEEHAASDKNGDGIGDRAGYSVITLAADLKGIELGFWRDQVWAQADGAAEPPPNTNTLFTHAEGAPFDTTDGLVAYDLHIKGDRYTLENEGATILSGALRDYSVFGFPYNVPSFLFFGDDSSSASGTIRFAYAAVDAEPQPTPTTPEATGTASPEATATTGPTPTASPPPSPTEILHRFVAFLPAARRSGGR